MTKGNRMNKKGDFMEQMRFSAPEEYPKIEVVKPNLPFAKKLLSAYSARDSEMSATTSYCYRAVVLEPRYPALSRIMSGIARVEMLHLTTLAKLIYLLGYDPKYRILQNTEPSFWNGDYVSYKKDPESILKTAIQEEKGAHKGYLELSEQACDKNVAKILYRLSLDEKLHVQILEAELCKLKKYAARS